MAEEIENNVQKLRKDAGVTQRDLADAVGVTRQTIIAIEKGGYTPSLMLALKIAHFFGKKIEEVFSIKNT